MCTNICAMGGGQLIDQSGEVQTFVSRSTVLATGGAGKVYVYTSHPDVAECAVVGVADELKGEIPLGFLVLNAGVERDHSEIVSEVVVLSYVKIRLHWYTNIMRSHRLLCNHLKNVHQMYKIDRCS